MSDMRRRQVGSSDGGSSSGDRGASSSPEISSRSGSLGCPTSEAITSSSVVTHRPSSEARNGCPAAWAASAARRSHTMASRRSPRAHSALAVEIPHTTSSSSSGCGSGRATTRFAMSNTTYHRPHCGRLPHRTKRADVRFKRRASPTARRRRATRSLTAVDTARTNYGIGSALRPSGGPPPYIAAGSDALGRRPVRPGAVRSAGPPPAHAPWAAAQHRGAPAHLVDAIARRRLAGHAPREPADERQPRRAGVGGHRALVQEARDLSDQTRARFLRRHPACSMKHSNGKVKTTALPGRGPRAGGGRAAPSSASRPASPARSDGVRTRVTNRRQGK
ncbi:uncharacterized protein SOCEGT47_071850 [Sorangium cellulosum]|uniref:Uncharacterized protein n=1 Tax=Sorangium cellulosum TaxID=56 RepID=A0A4P2QAG4_SORCE|nr:uncharacterized protein SOCEGT47_071850 [Sorangium cellulosum]